MFDAASFKHYLSSILNDMIQIQQAQNKRIIYAAIDVPIFHHFNYPALSAFKMFYWMKAVVNAPSMQYKKFSVELISPELADLGKQIYKTYTNIPSDEIVYLSVHTFNKIITLNRKFIKETNIWLENLKKKSGLISGISQINRYKFFKSALDKVERLYDKI